MFHRIDKKNESELSDSMEEGQVDQEDVQITSGDDFTKSTTQIIKGNKVLATPAVRRLAMENNVSFQGRLSSQK